MPGIVESRPTDQLENGVQVLIAVASSLPEAYVIFETLNDRGADLTTADLLKNYLFSEPSVRNSPTSSMVGTRSKRTAAANPT